jgi:4a-hydroxytetrahydrobiopterin dehydratase
MQVATADQLTHKKCKPCEGGVEPATPEEAKQQLTKLSGWSLSSDGKRIRKEWTVKDFMAGIRFFNDCAKIAEADQHHPDLHLTGYRNVAIELSTHAIGGLSENDFILAAKIDQVPVELKKK